MKLRYIYEKLSYKGQANTHLLCLSLSRFLKLLLGSSAFQFDGDTCRPSYTEQCTKKNAVTQQPVFTRQFFPYSEFVGMSVLKAFCTCAHTRCPWLRQVRSSDEEEAAPLYRKKLNPLLTRWTEVVLFTIAKGQTAQSHRALPYQSPWPWQEKKRKKKKRFPCKEMAEANPWGL